MPIVASHAAVADEGETAEGINIDDILNFKSFNLGPGTVKDKRRKLDAYKEQLLNDHNSYKNCQ